MLSLETCTRQFFTFEIEEDDLQEQLQAAFAEVRDDGTMQQYKAKAVKLKKAREGERERESAKSESAAAASKIKKAGGGGGEGGVSGSDGRPPQRLPPAVPPSSAGNNNDGRRLRKSRSSHGSNTGDEGSAGVGSSSRSENGDMLSDVHNGESDLVYRVRKKGAPQAQLMQNHDEDDEEKLKKQLKDAKKRMKKHMKLQEWLKEKEQRELALLEMEAQQIEQERQHMQAKDAAFRQHAKKQKKKLEDHYSTVRGSANADNDNANAAALHDDDYYEDDEGHAPNGIASA